MSQLLENPKTNDYEYFNHLLETAKALQCLDEDYKYNRAKYAYPEFGPYRRELYPKDLEFFKRGLKHRFRAATGGNRTGKSFKMCYEGACHLTGNYPTWWQGKVVKNPKLVWIIGEKYSLMRDSVQKALFGENEEELGTGLVAKAQIEDVKYAHGSNGCVEVARIRHKRGHLVTVVFKTYEMNREAFQAASVDLIMFDEEPPEHIYEEACMRLMGTGAKEPGMAMLAFTPLKGISEVYLKFFPDGNYPEDGVHPDVPSRWVTTTGWEDKLPHMNEEDMKEQEANIHPSMRAARMQGIASVGAGQIYSILEESYIIDPIEIPDYWPRTYAIDFGFHNTAVLFGAKDPSTDTIYIYTEYKSGGTGTSPIIHAQAIKDMGGGWMTGLADPSGGGRDNNTGKLLRHQYEDYGLCLENANNSVIAGITRVYSWLQTGKLKIFSTCVRLRREMGLYRYDPKNPNIPAPKQDDHLCDALRYLISRFDAIAKSKFDSLYPKKNSNYNTKLHQDDLTGY